MSIDTIIQTHKYVMSSIILVQPVMHHVTFICKITNKNMQHIYFYIYMIDLYSMHVRSNVVIETLKAKITFCICSMFIMQCFIA